MFFKMNMQDPAKKSVNIPLIYPFDSSYLIMHECKNCQNIIWTHAKIHKLHVCFFDQFMKLMT